MSSELDGAHAGGHSISNRGAKYDLMACTSSHWVKRSQADSSRTGGIFHPKGPRLAYVTAGFGSGFAKAWRANVKALIGFDNPDREFFRIHGEKYILGIPNVREYIDAAAMGMSQDSPDGDNRSAHASTAGFAEYAGSGNTDEIEQESAYWIKSRTKPTETTAPHALVLDAPHRTAAAELRTGSRQRAQGSAGAKPVPGEHETVPVEGPAVWKAEGAVGMLDAGSP
ncbi:hypothetical protein JCM21900_003251 [Sporobolomyces salmonicolor]